MDHIHQADLDNKQGKRGVALLSVLILGTIFLQKFALPFGSGSVFLTLVVMGVLAGYGFLRGTLGINIKILFLYLSMIAGLTLTQLLGGFDFSVLSLLLLFILHGFYIFRLKDDRSREKILLFFQKIMACIAVLGIVQYCAQFLIGPQAAFPIDYYVPKNWLAPVFHGLNPVNSSGDIYKSTAVFFLEPAFLCQFLALNIIIEVIHFRNWKRLALFFIATALTFSGTGLLILFVLLPVYLIRQGKFILLSLLAVFALTSPFWSPFVGLDKTVARAGEVTNKYSSGYARFVSIFPTLNTYIVPETKTLLVGRGAGSILRTLDAKKQDYEAHNPSWGKIIFEYGVIGGLFYFVFIGYAFFTSKCSWYIKSALLIQLMLLGEYVLSPVIQGLVLALVIWPGTEEQKGRDYA